MSGPLDRFNRLALYYDLLKRLVFGKALYKSQVQFLRSIPPGSSLLIIGGGSGEILPFMEKTNPTCSIYYVEASSDMLAKATTKVSSAFRNRVRFVHGTEESVPENSVFDVIITNFVLDLFPTKKTLALCQNLFKKLHDDGIWLVSDFLDRGIWWQQLLLWTMYRFFILTCGIEATALPSWEEQLRVAGMKESDCKLFLRGFVKSALYRKAGSP